MAKSTRTMNPDLSFVGKFKGPRFAPSGITARGYEGTRIRRWEVYQSRTIAAGMRMRYGWAKAEDIEITDENHLKLSEWLTTCLVGPDSHSLFRPGTSGRKAVHNEVPREELAAAIVMACKMAMVFDDDLGS